MRTIWTQGTAARSLTVNWSCNSDPSAGTVEYAVQAASTDDAPTSGWSAGTIDSYSATTGLAVTTTPTIGGTSATLSLTDGTVYALWARLSVGDEVIILTADRLLAR